MQVGKQCVEANSGSGRSTCNYPACGVTVWRPVCRLILYEAGGQHLPRHPSANHSRPGVNPFELNHRNRCSNNAWPSSDILAVVTGLELAQLTGSLTPVSRYVLSGRRRCQIQNVGSGNCGKLLHVHFSAPWTIAIMAVIRSISYSLQVSRLLLAETSSPPVDKKPSGDSFPFLGEYHARLYACVHVSPCGQSA